MDYIAQPKDYWIAPSAINITRNALGDPNRMQGSVASGAAILCYIEGVAGLGYDNGHRFRTWPLTISPTYFNSNTEKYVYVAIPRSAEVGTQAIVVFPSEKLDIYGINESDAQVGSTDYYYIWLQGIITATDGTSNREWQQAIDFGKKGTDEDLYDDASSEWYIYSKVNEVVTFLKNIRMKAGTTFQNLILGYKELTGVATSDITYTDSDTLVATPGYVESQYLSKTHESEAQEQIGFLKGLWVGVRSLYEITANGIAKLKSVIAEDVSSRRVQTGEIKSPNYTGDGVADTGFRLTNAYNGHSKLTIDELYVRMKAVFESLEVRERTYTGGDQIWSCAGNRIIRVDYLGNVETADHVPQMINVHADGRPEGQGQGDVYSVPVPGDTYGYSDVKVPWLLRQMPLLARAKVFARYRKVRIVINEPDDSSTNRAAAAESPLANIRRARCYFLAKDDDMEVHNWWRINDLARCQTMNLANTTRQTYLSGEDEKAGNIFWWRKVIGVSYEPVTLDDGKQYHYFDVSFDYEYEQSHPEVMVTSVMEGSDIPAAQDSVVQFGNTIIEGRMNLMMMEVNGSDAVGYNPTTDAPCLKAYRGVYCFDLNKSWVGGNACKMKLSPKTGYEFYGPNFKQVTEYDVVPVPVDRGLWTDITPTRDDYREHAMVRKCYYYDKVSHNGSYWLCSIVDGSHWVDSSGNYISDADYSALAEDQKALCSRKQNYTIDEPSEDSIDWTLLVEKGSSGTSGDTPAMLFTSVVHGTTPTAPVCTAANYMADTLPQGWTKNAPNRAAGYDVFLSQNTVTIDASGGYALKNVNWSTPTRISGDKGDAGADADDREWIYIGDTEYRSTYADATHTHPDSISQGEVSPSGTASGSDTNKQQDDWVPNGWSDTAIAINDTTHKFVYASWRDKDRTTDTWGSFQDPILWSNWGVQGTDGDGVQYVYKLFDHELTDAERTSNIPTKPASPDASGEWIPTGWGDNPLAPTENLPYCYCSVIKRINGTWGNFETLGLWSRYSKDGESQPDYIQTQEAWSDVESVASETTEPTPNGGWSDTTPANTNDYAYLWRRSRKMVLQSDGTYAAATGSDGQWKYTRLSGTNGTSIKTKGTIVAAEAGSVTLPTTGVSNGDLGIKQGDATIWTFNGTTWAESATESADGDCYTVTKDCTVDLDGDGTPTNIKGHLIMWSEEAHTQSSNKGWIDLGEFKGDPGTTYYTHIAWATSVDTTIPWSGTIPDGQISTPNYGQGAVTGGDPAPSDSKSWMGTLINTSSGPDTTNWHYYTWQKVEGPQGEGGWSYWAEPENVFIVQHYDSEVSFDSVTVKFKVMKGGTPVAINSLSNIVSLEFNAAQESSSGDGAKKVVVSSPKTYTTVYGITEYYTKGYLTLNINVTDPDTGSAVTFPITVACFAQLMGKITTKIKGDVETTVAEKLSYGIDPTEQTSYSLQQVGTYIRSASVKADTLSETVENLTTANPANIFGFTKGVKLLDSTWPVLPFIQDYGIEVYAQYGGVVKGRIQNLGFNGIEDNYVLTCEVLASQVVGGERFRFELCDQLPTRVISGLGSNKEYVPSTSEWKKVSAVYAITRAAVQNFDTLVGADGYNGFLDVESTASGTSTRIYIRKLQIERGSVPSSFGICDEDNMYAVNNDHECAKTTGNVELDNTDKWGSNPASGDRFAATGGTWNNMAIYANSAPLTDSNGATDGNYRIMELSAGSLRIAANTPYTLSFWAKASSDGAKMRSYLVCSNTGGQVSETYSAMEHRQTASTAADGFTQITLGTTWRKYYVHFYAQSAVTNGYAVGIRISTADSLPSNCIFSVCGLRLEKGYITSYNRTDYETVFRQTSRSIDMSVLVNSVKKAGIQLTTNQSGEVTEGLVNLMGDKVVFSNSTGTVSGKVWIDPDTGTLHAVDGKFSGNIYTPYKRLTSSNISEYETENFYGDTVINLAKAGSNLQVEVSRETPDNPVHISLPKITADMLGCEVNIFNASDSVIMIEGSGRAGQVSSGGYFAALVKPSGGLGVNANLELNAGYEAKFKAIHNPYMTQHENFQYSWLCCYANSNP